LPKIEKSRKAIFVASGGTHAQPGVLHREQEILKKKLKYVTTKTYWISRLAENLRTHVCSLFNYLPLERGTIYVAVANRNTI
jgi:hypothetical protein